VPRPRYNRETLEIQYKGKNITQVLDLTVEDAHAFFSAVPNMARKLQTLLDVGLGYIRWARAPPPCPAARRSA
jgi:excinuclease ABC subunit A